MSNRATSITNYDEDKKHAKELLETRVFDNGVGNQLVTYDKKNGFDYVLDDQSRRRLPEDYLEYIRRGFSKKCMKL